MTKRIQEIKKLDDNKIAVKWEGDSKFYLVTDDTIATYILYTMITSKKELVQNQNSMCR